MLSFLPKVHNFYTCPPNNTIPSLEVLYIHFSWPTIRLAQMHAHASILFAIGIYDITYHIKYGLIRELYRLLGHDVARIFQIYSRAG